MESKVRKAVHQASDVIYSLSTSLSSAKGSRRVLQEETSTGSWFKYLPPSITEFQPALRTLAQPIQREQLRDTLQQWINT